MSIDDLSPDDVRSKTVAADDQTDLAEPPEFSGEIPGFSDWREELRERLKRIRESRAGELLDTDAERQDGAASADARQQHATASDAATLEAAAPASDTQAAATPASQAVTAPATKAAGAPGSPELALPQVGAEPPEDTVAAALATADGPTVGEDPEPQEASPESEPGVVREIAEGRNDDTAPAVRVPTYAAQPRRVAGGRNDDTAPAVRVPPPGPASPEGRAGRNDEAAPAVRVPATSELIARLVDGEAPADAEDSSPPRGVAAPAEPGDSTLSGAAEVIDRDLDTGAARAADGEADANTAPEEDAGPAIDESPDALILGERDAHAVDVETDAVHSEPASDAARERPVDPADEIAGDEPIGESTQQPVLELIEVAPVAGPVIMPDVGVDHADADGAADPLAASAAMAPKLDVPVDQDDTRALTWDASPPTVATALSSAAPLGERAAAALCDTLILIALGTALVGAASSGTGVSFGQILLRETIWLGLTWAIFATGYSVFFVGTCGQTIGRMIMRLRVIGDDQFTVGFDRAAWRLGAWVIFATPLLAGMVPAIKDPEHRAAHDRLSRTRVVKA